MGEFLDLSPRTIRVFAWVGVALVVLFVVGALVCLVQHRWTRVGLYLLLVLIIAPLTARGFRTPQRATIPPGVGADVDRDPRG